MSIVSKRQFAKLAGVVPSAISSAIAAGLVVPVGPRARDGIDTALDRNAAYLRYPDHQRHDAAWQKRVRAARSERAVRDAQAEFDRIMQMKPGFDRVAALTDFYWNLGAFPEGWAILGLRDMKAENGLPVPLIFYSPDSEEGDLGVGSLTRSYKIVDDGKGPVAARDDAGVDHPLVLRMFGKVPWLQKQVRPRATPTPDKSRKATKSKPSVGPSAVSKHEEQATARGVTDSAGKGGGRSKSYRKVGLDVSGSKTEKTGRRIPPERN